MRGSFLNRSLLGRTRHDPLLLQELLQAGSRRVQQNRPLRDRHRYVLEPRAWQSLLGVRPVATSWQWSNCLSAAALVRLIVDDVSEPSVVDCGFRRLGGDRFVALT